MLHGVVDILDACRHFCSPDSHIAMRCTWSALGIGHWGEGFEGVVTFP